MDPRKIASEYKSLSEIMAKIGDLRNGPAELVMEMRDFLGRELVYSSNGGQHG